MAIRTEVIEFGSDVHLDAWMCHYNTERTHQGRWCYGKTPMPGESGEGFMG